MLVNWRVAMMMPLLSDEHPPLLFSAGIKRCTGSVLSLTDLQVLYCKVSGNALIFSSAEEDT